MSTDKVRLEGWRVVPLEILVEANSIPALERVIKERSRPYIRLDDGTYLITTSPGQAMEGRP